MKTDIPPENAALFEQELEHWGPELQVIAFAEEFGEAIHALSKHCRERYLDGPKQDANEPTIVRCIEELADCQNMIEQMLVMLWLHSKGHSLRSVLNYFDSVREYKLARLRGQAESLTQKIPHKQAIHT